VIRRAPSYILYISPPPPNAVHKIRDFGSR